VAKGGQWVARCRFRGLDGVTRHVQRAGPHPDRRSPCASGELRNQRGERSRCCSPTRARRHEYLADEDQSPSRGPNARIYSDWLEKLVLPELGELRLNECDVAQIDAFFTRLEQTRRTASGDESRLGYAANTRRTIRAIISGVLQQTVLQQTVLHRAIPSNPVRELERIESPKGQRSTTPHGLTTEERRRLFDFVDTNPSLSRPTCPI